MNWENICLDSGVHWAKVKIKFTMPREREVEDATKGIIYDVQLHLWDTHDGAGVTSSGCHQLIFTNKSSNYWDYWWQSPFGVIYGHLAWLPFDSTSHAVVTKRCKSTFSHPLWLFSKPFREAFFTWKQSWDGQEMGNLEKIPTSKNIWTFVLKNYKS